MSFCSPLTPQHVGRGGMWEARPRLVLAKAGKAAYGAPERAACAGKPVWLQPDMVSVDKF